jgi:hypothetical protein
MREEAVSKGQSLFYVEKAVEKTKAAEAAKCSRLTS